MYYANVRMHHFIRVLYAQLMGVPVEDIEHAFDRPSQIAQQLVKLNIIEKRQADPTYVPQPYMTISSAGEGRGDEKVERGDSGENSSQETTNE
jgi:hypothetical protein